MFSSVNYRKIFLIRFTGYFLIQIGLVALVLTIEPVVVEEFKFKADLIFGRQHTLPKVITSAGDRSGPSPKEKQDGGGFGSLALGSSKLITPVSTDFGIVIEKINANALVIPDVDPGNEREYIAALSKGVAHARGTAFPGQKGNIYLFSHSTDAPWNIVRYNAVFFLLKELDEGDKIIMFYHGRRYDYIVFDKVIAKADDTEYLTNTYNESILTLQTCDPPGTVVRRLIVRAKLAIE